MTDDALPRTDPAPDDPRAPASPDGASSTAAIAIETSGLTKSYSGQLALDHLDLRIAQGDIFGYIGPNGAGKTTTIRILAALLRPSSGSARVHGIDVDLHPREIKRLVGYMPDSFGVYDNMTLAEYLHFFAAAYEVPRGTRKKVVDDVLALTDLGPKRDDLVNAFSRGMKQRACLARTLLHNPRVLILDEPASGLDPRARIELRELLKELQRMGKTVVVSSHILTELSTICSTVGIIEAGKLVAAGDVRSILRTLRANRVYSIELLRPTDGERAVEFFRGQRIVSEVERNDSQLRVTLEASDEETADLIDALVAERIRIVGFHEEVVDLETAFLTLTKGELR